MIRISYIKEKTLPYILAGALALVTLVGCKEIKTETSGVLHEDATVVNKIYTPSVHQAELNPTISKVGSSFGMSGDGVGMSFGGMTITESTVPEKYGAVFKCKHGTFISQGSDKRHKNLYNKLQEGQEVDVTYKESYRATYDDIDDDGKKDLIERVLIKFDFLDANPKKK